MTLYSLTDPEDYTFARFSYIGTWSEGSLCPECTRSTEVLMPPLQIEWEPDSCVIGDFSWCGFHCVVTTRIISLLDSLSVEYKKANVVVVKPTTSAKGKAVVPYPYTGPELYWIYDVPCLSIDLGRSEVSLVRKCSACGHDKYRFQQDNLCIRKADYHGESLFRVQQYSPSGFLLASERIANELCRHDVTNLKARVAGEIV